jgi:hypothetical protein
MEPIEATTISDLPIAVEPIEATLIKLICPLWWSQGLNFIVAIALEGEQNAVDYCSNDGNFLPYSVIFILFTVHSILIYLNSDVDQIMRSSYMCDFFLAPATQRLCNGLNFIALLARVKW